jgi:hypothetical protein
MSYRFMPINSSSTAAQVAQINKNFAELDREAVTKTFKGPGGKHSILQGKLPNDRYGQIYYDNDGTARILIGQSPDDGRMGIWISKPGKDVISLLE